MDDLGTTNLWLGILAAVAVIELLAFAVGGFVAYRVWRRLDAMLDRIEAQQITPLADRAHGLMDSVQARLEQVDRTVEAVKGGVRGRLWPVVGLVRAVGAGVGTLRGRSSSASRSSRRSPDAGAGMS